MTPTKNWIPISVPGTNPKSFVFPHLLAHLTANLCAKNHFIRTFPESIFPNANQIFQMPATTCSFCFYSAKLQSLALAFSGQQVPKVNAICESPWTVYSFHRSLWAVLMGQLLWKLWLWLACLIRKVVVSVICICGFKMQHLSLLIYICSQLLAEKPSLMLLCGESWQGDGHRCGRGVQWCLPGQHTFLQCPGPGSNCS